MKRVWIAMAVALACVGACPTQAMPDTLGSVHAIVSEQRAADVLAPAATEKAIAELADKWNIAMGRHHYYRFLSEEEKARKYEKGMYQVADAFVDELEARVYFYRQRHHWSEDAYAWKQLHALAEKVRKEMPKAKVEKREADMVREQLQAALSETDSKELQYFMNEAIWYASKIVQRDMDKRYSDRYPKTIFRK